MQLKRVFKLDSFNSISDYFPTGESQRKTTNNPILLKQYLTPVGRFMGISTDRSYLRIYKCKKFVPRNKLIRKQQHGKQRPIEVKKTYYNTVKRTLTIKQSYSQKAKQDNIQHIYDWMMEVASLIKITKNSYYRAILIIENMIQNDGKILLSKHMSGYVCGALSVAAKFQSSRFNYLQTIYNTNQRRVCKTDIILAQNDILNFIKFKVPKVLIEQTLSSIIQCWNKFIQQEFTSCRRDKKLLIGCGSNNSTICYLEMVYIIDYIVVKMHQQFLKEGDFKVPTLIAMYIQLSIQLGDAQLNQHYIWPSFNKFIKQTSLLKQHQLSQFKNQAIYHFKDLNISQAMQGGVPLNLKFERCVLKHEQTYIRKIEGT